MPSLKGEEGQAICRVPIIHPARILHRELAAIVAKVQVGDGGETVVGLHDYR